jgi:hypothetical protein
MARQDCACAWESLTPEGVSYRTGTDNLTRNGQFGRNGGNRKSGSFAVALKKRRARGLARFLGRNLRSNDSVNQET